MLNLAVELNILLAVFNLIPIPPLDGGNILAGLLPAAAARSLDRVRPYGFLLLYALMLTGGLAYLVGPPSNLLRNLLP
jgi:Zn-dependent protease